MPVTPEELEDYKDELYDRCRQNFDKAYFQHDFEEMDIVSTGDITDLLQVVQGLVSDMRFILLQAQGVVSYKLRTPEAAKIYQSLNFEEGLVYGHIEESGASGLWTKTIKGRTNLPDATVKSIFKTLEKRKLITDHKTVEYPSRKMYIITSIRPNDRSTGGAWYTDNELDEEFINQILGVLYKYIDDRSWRRPKERELKSRFKNLAEIEALREKAFAETHAHIEIEPEVEGFVHKKRINDATYPFPSTHPGYPTLHDCALKIMDSGATNTTLTAEDVQQLLDLLCWDGKIEKVDRVPVAYKSVRLSNDDLRGEGPSNGLTEAPCGRCPVFDLCEEGGPVGPSNCQYFSQWFAF